MSRTKALAVVMLIVSIYAPRAFAQEFTTIFNATVEGRRIIAVSVQGAVYIGDVIDDMRPYAGPNRTVLAYIDHGPVSEAEPLVAFVDGELQTFAAMPGRSTVPPTIADTMQLATTIERGPRSGAICKDGSRTTITNDGACSINGGVVEWLYSAVAKSDGKKTIAAICNDHRLVSGEGGRCGASGVLVEVKALVYAPPTVAPPPSEEPAAEPDPEADTVRPVEPLPGRPSMGMPTLSDSDVEWSERQDGQVGFVWSTTVTNPIAIPVRVLVALRLRDAAGRIVHSDEYVVDLAANDVVEVADQGLVSEGVALRADRWTFDVEAAPDDTPSGGEQIASVTLVIDPLAEEARITNFGSDEVDLNGWSLVSRNGGERFTFRFFKLGAGDTVVLTSGDGARSRLPEIYLWTAAEIWSDGGDVGELRDPQGRVRAKTNPDGSAAR